MLTPFYMSIIKNNFGYNFYSSQVNKREDVYFTSTAGII